MKSLIVIFSFCAIFLAGAAMVEAHVVVKPITVGVGAFQTFTVGVPNEKDMPTTQVRLIIPQKLEHVTPNVKPGWTIDIKKEGSGEDATVTEITWHGGSIPVGQRDEFLFSAKVPADETTLVWKAYQTYEDGTVVSWDQKPQKDSHSHGNTPYSQTHTINDLKTPKETTKIQKEKTDTISFSFAIIALILSSASLIISLRRK